MTARVANNPDAIAKMVRQLSKVHPSLEFVYEAGCCGYNIYRQIQGLGHTVQVCAPSLIPRRPGDRVKNDRRDAMSLARLLRAGELTPVWVPDPSHEALRDLVRTGIMLSAHGSGPRPMIMSLYLPPKCAAHRIR